ncbi:hypothetical protein ACLB2K_008854 [Fragaria x ananassa]
MATLKMKLFCIVLPLFFASALAIEAHWRGFVPNPLLAHQGGFGFSFDHNDHTPTGGFHLFDEAQPVAASKAVANDPAQPANAAAAAAAGDAPAQPDFPFVNNRGAWELLLQDSGVSVMHLNLLPNNKIMFYDAAATHISNIKLPNGECLPWKNDQGVVAQDCNAHGVEYDIATNKIRPLKITTDAWCSSGGVMPDGRFISTGGWADGIKSIRYFTPCDDGKCDFKDYPDTLNAERWYATQITLADGRLFLAGGRHSYSYEYVPPEGQKSAGSIVSELLDTTTDTDENNLYPFVFQSSDGNIFIFANDQSILFNPKTNRQIKKFPTLPGGARNYPASGMSALLPIELKEKNPDVIPIEVIVCGGALKEAYAASAKPENRVFLPALNDCGRMVITDPNPQWDKEEMPSRRVMGDMLNLPTGDLLIINGAKAGTSAWWQAEDPNFTPHIYNPKFPKGQRFFDMAPTTIPRMYHSTSAVLPSTKILVAGSNPNSGYWFAPDVKYKTELRLETFSPPYLDASLDIHRPAIDAGATSKKLTYGADFNIQFKVNEADKPGKNDFKVHMYAVPFTTHGYSMNQRLLSLAKKDFKAVGGGVYSITALAPPSGNVAPPGFYLVFVVHRGVPSQGVWVQMNQ